jgi:hypothetical protein
MSDLRTIRMNDGREVIQPVARARYLVSRRLAEWVDTPEVLTPLEPADTGDAAWYGEDMTKAQLVELAEARDLPTYGTKAEIIARLDEAAASDQLSATETVGATTEDEPSNPSGSDDDDS